MKLRDVIIGAAFVLCAGLAINHRAHADSLIILGASKHVNTQNPHRERNPGLGFEHNGLMVAAYANSDYHTSVYALYPIYTRDLGHGFSFSLPAGAVSGYGRPVTPVILPALTFSTRYIAADITILPPLGHSMGIIGLQVRVEIGR